MVPIRKLFLVVASVAMAMLCANADGMLLSKDLLRSMGTDLAAPSQNDPKFVAQAVRAYKTCMRHNYKSAIKQFHALIRTYPENPDANMLAAVCLSWAYIYSRPLRPDLSHVPEIDRLLSKATTLKPHEEEWEAFYALFLQERGRYRAATRMFSELFKNSNYRTNKKFRYTVINYAIALGKLGKHDKAAEEIGKSVKATDYDAALSRDYVVALSRAGRIRDMRTFVAEYNEKKGFSAKIVDVECYQLAAHQQYSDARECYESLVSNRATSRVLLEAGYINISQLLRRKKKYEQALTWLDEAQKKLGETPRLEVEMANAYFNMGDYGKAARFYKRGINSGRGALSEKETQFAQMWLGAANRQLLLRRRSQTSNPGG